MNSPNLLVSVPQSHSMKTCVGCFGSRGECEGPWQWHVIADIPLFPSRGKAIINQTVSSACFSPGLPDIGRSHLSCWVLGQTIAFTRNGFWGFTEPSVKKQLFSSLTMHFPPLFHPSLCPFQILNNSVYDFLKKKRKGKNNGTSWCHLTFLGKVIIALKEKNPLSEVYVVLLHLKV